jgi:hypothetical protein
MLPGNAIYPGGHCSRGAKGIPRVVGHLHGVAHFQPLKDLRGLLHHNKHACRFCIPYPELVSMFDTVNRNFHAFQLIISHMGFPMLPRPTCRFEHKTMHVLLKSKKRAEPSKDFERPEDENTSPAFQHRGLRARNNFPQLFQGVLGFGLPGVHFAEVPHSPEECALRL